MTGVADPAGRAGAVATAKLHQDQGSRMVAYPRSFDGQFLVGRTADIPSIDQGHTETLKDLTIVTIGEMPVIRIRDASDRLVGALLGYPVDYRRGRMIQGALKLEFPWPGPAGLDTAIEDTIYTLSGSYLFVLDDGRTRRIYMDAGASLSAVFDPETRLCAATTGLLLNKVEYESRFNKALYDYLRVDDDGWFPAGLTAHRGINRMLGNHYLDLDAGVQVRHWPIRAPSLSTEPDAECARINQVIARTMEVLQSAGPIATTLTAGNDARMVLAACRPVRDGLNLFTLAGTSSTKLDAVRAAELAKMAGIRHQLLPIRYGDADGVAQWCARSSHCIGGPNSLTYPSVEPIKAYAFFTGGVGGETGRAFFWRPSDTDDIDLTARGLTARFGMPVHDEVVAAVDGWLKGLPPMGAFHILDMAFIELRLGCWGFSQTYATPEVREIQPLISRESFVAMLSLPAEWRRTNRMVTRSIELAWPELLRLPINRYGDYRDTLTPAMRALRNPRLILRKFRKMFG